MPNSPLISRALPRLTVRVELPVLLYVDVDLPPGTSRGLGEELAKNAVFKWLGDPGMEEGVDVAVMGESSRILSSARVYPSDHDSIDSMGNFTVVDWEE